ncbi:ubiquitin-like domain-containing protein [Nocardia sp. NBC_01327]|uniref:ubiquitin-like domain-containing protein n=1 Tax=Nocardia sp. NBC_01327 TaxID=2903593 RepID=UPI002E121F59|nr:ubiquitin family protein [Nocardia sp. NBC_01327]
MLSVAGIILTPAVAQAVPAPSGTFLDSPARQAVQTITITVTSESNSSISVVIAPTATVAKFKQTILAQTGATSGFLPENSNLEFNDTKNQQFVILEDAKTLASYGMYDGCEVFVFPA